MFMQSLDILLQPLLPLLGCPRTTNLVVHNTVEHDRGGYMHTGQSIRLDLHLDIIRDPIARVQTSVLTGLITNLQQSVDLALIDTHGPSNLSKPLIRSIPRFIYQTDIEEVFLLVEQLLGEIPEFGRVNLLDGIAGFVDECRGGVPRLDLLPEDSHDAVGVLL